MMQVTPSDGVAPIDCRSAVSRLWDFLDRELDSTRLAEVEAHVALCEKCAEHFRFARAFLAAVTGAWKVDPAAAQLRERVVTMLEREGFERGV